MLDKILSTNSESIVQSQNLDRIKAVGVTNPFEEADSAYFIDESNISSAALQKYQKELDSLEEKKVKQDELVVVYRNSEDELFIIPNSYGVSCEDLKEAFGIKDGVILKYNREELGYTWGVGGPEGRGYRDYTGASVPRDGIEIPLSSIKG